MVVIVDYGMGNLRSVAKAVERTGVKVRISGEKEDIERAEKIVLPGVGNFSRAMDNLERGGLVEIIREKILSGCPYLGICLGLQLLFEWSEEGGRKGMGVVRGKVVRFPPSSLKVPHMGWNKVHFSSRKPSPPLFKEIPDNSYFYFVHSYYVVPEEESLVASTTSYGIEFVSSVSFLNAFACQFHPEKSGKLGLKLIENFLKT